MDLSLDILDCEDCGACCSAVGHPHFYRNSHNELWNKLPAELQQEVNEYIDGLTDIDLGQPCFWLDPQTKKCRHYEYRPEVCRDFELGSHHCHRLRKAHGLD